MKILAVDDKKLTLEALEDAIKKAEPSAELYCFRSEKMLWILTEPPNVM